MNRRGFSLIECLVYITVLTVVLGLGFSAFYRCQQSTRDLGRNADDIVRTLRAGERWREDVRAAVVPPRLLDNGRDLQIRTRDRTVVYAFTDGAVWRKAGTDNAAVLKGVRNSRMLPDDRGHVRAWCWEVELASPQKVVRVRPLFSFGAVNIPKE